MIGAVAWHCVVVVVVVSILIITMIIITLTTTHQLLILLRTITKLKTELKNETKPIK